MSLFKIISVARNQRGVNGKESLQFLPTHKEKSIMINRLLVAVAMLCAVSEAQVTVAPLLQPHQTFVDASGSPCAGCSLYSYVAGTTTPQPTYTDASGGVPNTNPLVLSAQGGANIWVNKSLAYKYVLKNPQGTTIWTVDYVTAAGGGAILSDPSGTQTITQPSLSDFNVSTSGGGKFYYNSAEVATVSGVANQAVVKAPTGNQTVIQPTGTTLASSSLNGVLNEQPFVGDTLTDRISAAVTSCGTNPCNIIIPANEPSGAFTPPTATNTLLEDRRFFNGVGFANNAQPDIRSGSVSLVVNSANRSYESAFQSGTFVTDLECVANAGGIAHDQTTANSGCLIMYSTRTAGNRPIWGTDINFQYANQLNTAYGLEIDSVNNSGTPDPGDGTVGAGTVIIASGASKNGVGLLVQGSDQSWRNDVVLRNYDMFGIQLQSGIARQADIFVIPFANDTVPVLQVRNAGNNANVAIIDSLGNITSASLSASVVASSVNITGLDETLTGTMSSQNVVATGVIDTPLYRAGGTNGITGVCGASTVITVKAGIITGCI